MEARSLRVHRLMLKRGWEAGWRPLAEVEDCVQGGTKEEEEEEEGSPFCSSSVTSDIEGLLE